MKYILCEKYLLEEDNSAEDPKADTLAALKSTTETLNKLMQSAKEEQNNLKQQQSEQVNKAIEETETAVVQDMATSLAASAGAKPEEKTEPSVTNPDSQAQQKTVNSMEDLQKKQKAIQNALTITRAIQGSVGMLNGELSQKALEKLAFIITQCNKITFASFTGDLEDYCNQLKKLDTSGEK